MKFKIGYLYEIEFKDHSAGCTGPMNCMAVGYVLEDHKDYVYLTSWMVKTDDLSVRNSNLESFVLLKSCIEKRRLLCKTKRS